MIPEIKVMIPPTKSLKSCVEPKTKPPKIEAITPTMIKIILKTYPCSSKSINIRSISHYLLNEPLT